MINEQELTDELEDACGGPDKTFRLLDIYRRATRACSGNEFRLSGKPIDQTEIFTKSAKRDGYTAKQVRMFLQYQDIVS